jgi:hypothetical protein
VCAFAAAGPLLPQLPEAAGPCACLSWHDAVAGLPPLLAAGHGAGGGIWAYRPSTMMWQVSICGGARLAVRARSSRAPVHALSVTAVGAAAVWKPAPLQELAAFSAPPGVSSQQLSALHWAPACGRPYELLAAAYGSSVVLYQVTQAPGAAAAAAATEQSAAPLLRVKALQALRHPAGVYQLEFNGLGTTLAASLNDSPDIWLWMPALSGVWEATTRLAGSPAAAEPVGGGGGGGVATTGGGGTGGAGSAVMTMGATELEVD